jgi:HEAT repeat protein
MLTFYCPQCWMNVEQRNVVCPHCGINIEQALGRKDYASSLIAALCHFERDTPIRAAHILGMLRTREAVIPLIRLIAGDADICQKTAAIEALARIGDIRAEPALQRVVRDGPNPLRHAASEALLQIRDQSAEAAALLVDGQE